ncbi:MAG: ABC transporter ATP-binding protein/permease [Lachnospiraceae bacterium]|nr:ABC transporter ATP-binding protein/permease [Lachnospiraceae bacterium]
MLQIKTISKEYVTGELHQTALDKVSLNLRDNEFVAILGPSGSGKTTLLNIIGGLDRYDSGDLIINGISTKKYKDRDWDSYRNHTIGFVFQSYNLIPHQSILSNVELALTISGISRSERRKRAKQALIEVGLGDQLHKRPNQMSGGQMQRVAIARALVNNPDILLADEPTGALDTETSVQVMELLKEVAKDRLVVMVTHNPELAQDYATRIVKLRDGKITDDSDPYTVDEAKLDAPKHENMGKASMSFVTALSLSFHNLRTKKGRTFLTSFAGSIGIIGIALILSLSNGVNTYINDLQKSTMTSYPVTVEAQSMDLSSMLAAGKENTDSANAEATHELDAVYSDGSSIEMASAMTTSITENNLTEFKKYLDDESSEIHEYIGENGIVYSYDTQFGVYTHDPDGEFVNTDGSTLSDGEYSGGMGMMGMMGGASAGNDNFEEMLPGQNGDLISEAVTDSYDVLYGTWPDDYDEVVLVLDKNNEISATTLYELGVLPTTEYKELMEKINDGEDVTLETQNWSYEDICTQELYMIPACDTYLDNGNGTFTDISDDTAEIEKLLEGAVQLKIVGVIRPAEDADYASIGSAVGYTKALTDYIIAYTNDSAVVKAQEDSPEINVLNGVSFSPSDDAAKVEDAKAYLSNLSTEEKADMCREILTQVYGDDPANAQMMLDMSDTELAATLDEYVLSSEDAEDERLLMIYDSYISSGTYEDNMAAFGVVSLDAPSSISIYADSFEDKDAIAACIDDYNQTVSEENRISYTDYVGLLMSSVTTIVNVISYVLIAFVAVSLVVSSIMIGIITYISVLERTKEIGILRAIGASKRNISQVFNAETFIIGLLSGAIGIGITVLLLIPGNAIIHAVTGSASVNAILPVTSAIVLIILSVILTLIGGLIPSRKAARKDPVTALRTE